MRGLGGRISNAAPGPGAQALAGLTMRQGGLARTSKRNFGPQIGFAWTPGALFGHGFDNKLALRGGFGVGYNLQQLATLANGRANPPFTTSLTFDSSHCCVVYSAPGDVYAFSGWPSNPAAVNTFDTVTGLPIGGAAGNIHGFRDLPDTPGSPPGSLLPPYDRRQKPATSAGCSCRPSQSLRPQMSRS